MVNPRKCEGLPCPELEALSEPSPAHSEPAEPRGRGEMTIPDPWHPCKATDGRREPAQGSDGTLPVKPESAKCNRRKEFHTKSMKEHPPWAGASASLLIMITASMEEWLAALTPHRTGEEETKGTLNSFDGPVSTNAKLSLGSSSTQMGRGL